MSPEEVAALLERVGELSDQMTRLSAQNERLVAQSEKDRALIRWFQHQLFGPKSERRLLSELSPADQLWLGEQMLEYTENPPPEEVTVRAYERAQRGDKTTKLSADCSSSRLKFDESVPIKEIQVEDPELTRLDPTDIEFVGEEVTHRLAQQSSYVVLKFIRKVWKKKGDEAPSKVDMPEGIFDRSFADVSLLAGLVVDKCCFHLPLYRQHQRLKMSGVHLQRSTLTRLIQRVAELLEPIYDAQTSSVLQSSVLAIDESPTPAGRKNGKMRKGYYWALYGDQDEVHFIYDPSRSQAVVNAILENFQGTLLCDGYSAYDTFCQKNPSALLANCWSHTRRYFVKAENVEPEKTKWVLLQIQKLYSIEARARGKPKKLKTLRENESKPIVDSLFEYLRTEFERTSLLPSNPFVAAVEYAMTREQSLRVFLANPEVAMDTNHLEREIRPPVIGRKNWMFHTTEDGARHAGMLYSLVQTCRLHDINPRTYLIDVLQRIATHPAAEAYQLRPIEWKERFAGSPLTSLIDA